MFKYLLPQRNLWVTNQCNILKYNALSSFSMLLILRFTLNIARFTIRACGNVGKSGRFWSDFSKQLRKAAIFAGFRRCGISTRRNLDLFKFHININLQSLYPQIPRKTQIFVSFKLGIGRSQAKAIEWLQLEHASYRCRF